MLLKGVIILAALLLVNGDDVTNSSKNDVTVLPQYVSEGNVNTTTTEHTPSNVTTTTTTEHTPSTNVTTTTTTESTTTAVPPTPGPVPEPPRKFPGNTGQWNITEKNVSCIIFVGAIQLSVPYKLNDTNTVQTRNANATINVPHYADAEGSCVAENNKLTLSLVWNFNTTFEHENANNVLNFTFEANFTSNSSTDNGIPFRHYALRDISGVIQKYAPLFPNASNNEPEHVIVSNISAFLTQLNYSYACSSTEDLFGKRGKITLANLHVEAFQNHTSDSPRFSTTSVCPADDVTDIVPIAVGASLAALVVIVLIAYLIGRRRSRSRGYQSV